jgi:hypothetical protein
MNTFRWIALLPVAIVALMFGSFAGGIIASVFGQDISYVGSGFFGSFFFVFAACAVAPYKKARTGQISSLIIAVLAMGTVILANFTGIPEFHDLPDISKVTVPVFQIVGALYAMFIALPVILKAGTAEIFGRELAAASTMVVMLGVLVSSLGAVVGFFGAGWLTLVTGLVTVGLGVMTWVAAPITAAAFNRVPAN